MTMAIATYPQILARPRIELQAVCLHICRIFMMLGLISYDLVLTVTRSSILLSYQLIVVTLYYSSPPSGDGSGERETHLLIGSFAYTVGLLTRSSVIRPWPGRNPAVKLLSAGSELQARR